jgi:transposase
MTKKKVEAKKQGRTQYSAEFKRQALLRAVKEGIPAVAQDLGLEPAQLYAWRAKSQQLGQDAQAQQLMQSELARLKRELARVEEENAFLKKAAAYFAKQPK